MNLGQIELAIYDRLNFNATPDSAVTRRIRQYVNDAHREILGMRGFGQLRRAVLTASSVTASPFMVLPQASTSIIAIADRTTNRILNPISVQDLRFRDPGLNFSGSIPDSYAVINFAATVAADPDAAAALFVVSDSAVDGSGLSANVEGVITGGYYRRASVAMNGLTAVNLSAALSSWVHVTKFYVSGAAAGNITLHQTSGVGTELSRIAPGRSYPRYTQIHLSPTPATGSMYYCDVELHVEDMLNVNDEPLLPEDFHWLLECGAMKREYMKREKMTQWQVEHSNWRSGLANMGTLLRRRGGISLGGQRTNQGRQFSSYSSPWFPGN